MLHLQTYPIVATLFGGLLILGGLAAAFALAGHGWRRRVSHRHLRTLAWAAWSPMLGYVVLASGVESIPLVSLDVMRAVWGLAVLAWLLSAIPNPRR